MRTLICICTGLSELLVLSESSVKNMFCENINMYFIQGSLYWSKGGGFAPDPHDISRKLFRKCCKEYCFVRNVGMYPSVGSFGSAVKNMF